MHGRALAMLYRKEPCVGRVAPHKGIFVPPRLFYDDGRIIRLTKNRLFGALTGRCGSKSNFVFLRNADALDHAIISLTFAQIFSGVGGTLSNCGAKPATRSSSASTSIRALGTACIMSNASGFAAPFI